MRPVYPTDHLDDERSLEACCLRYLVWMVRGNVRPGIRLLEKPRLSL